MKLRWIISIIASLVLHLIVLHAAILTTPPKPDLLTPTVAVARSQPVDTPPAESDQQKPEPVEITDAEKTLLPDPTKFRPNEEQNTEQTETADAAPSQPEPEPEQKTEQTPEQNQPDMPQEKNGDIAKTEQSPKPENKTPSQDKQQPKSDYTKQIADYRRELLAEFQTEWQRIPTLATKVPEPHMLEAIDNHFGIKIIAYSFVDHKPAPPFIIFDTITGETEMLQNFNFSAYSNRIKDRMLTEKHRNALQRARQKFGLSGLMKLIGLVPLKTDRYFAAKQIRAVEMAGIALENAAQTNAHYESDGSEGFNLIIDSVTTKQGNVIAITDEELKYSAVANSINSKGGSL